jgi:predicted nucleic acid-binding protein
LRQFYVDTSALVKRYHDEIGTDVVNVLVDAIASGRANGVILSLALTETISTLHRKMNERVLDKGLFDKLITVLYEELQHFTILSLDDRKVVSSITYIMQYSLNSADALHLTAAVMARQSMAAKDDYVFVSCDKRLLTAAKKEKLSILNPEQRDAQRVVKLLNLK